MTHDPQELRRRAEVLAREADATSDDALACLLYLRSSRMILEAGTLDGTPEPVAESFASFAPPVQS